MDTDGRTHDSRAPLVIDLKPVMRYRREQGDRRHLVSHRAIGRRMISRLKGTDQRIAATHKVHGIKAVANHSARRASGEVPQLRV